MPTTRVVLVSNRSVLVAGIQRLLEGTNSVELSVVQEDAPDLQRHIQILAPQAILLDGEGVADQGMVTQMLEQQPAARVIVLGVQRKDIEVYSLRKVLHTDLDGLLEAIHGKKATRRAGKGYGE